MSHIKVISDWTGQVGSGNPIIFLAALDQQSYCVLGHNNLALASAGNTKWDVFGLSELQQW